MKITEKQISAVLKLPGDQRFKHFIKVVTDWQEAWGLYKDGWALAADIEGTTVFPLWPAKEYAELCAVDDWNGYQSRAISLDELRNILLPKLKNDGVLPGVFFTPQDKGVTPSVADLEAALLAELENY